MIFIDSEDLVDQLIRYEEEEKCLLLGAKCLYQTHFEQFFFAVFVHYCLFYVFGGYFVIVFSHKVNDYENFVHFDEIYENKNTSPIFWKG